MLHQSKSVKRIIVIKVAGHHSQKKDSAHKRQMTLSCLTIDESVTVITKQTCEKQHYNDKSSGASQLEGDEITNKENEKETEVSRTSTRATISCVAMDINIAETIGLLSNSSSISSAHKLASTSAIPETGKSNVVKRIGLDYPFGKDNLADILFSERRYSTCISDDCCDIKEIAEAVHVAQ